MSAPAPADASIPPYEADMFGSKFVGSIHGRMMLASSTAAILGPYLITQQRKVPPR
jgi:hypothetical protein